MMSIILMHVLLGALIVITIGCVMTFIVLFLMDRTWDWPWERKR
jgi:uncharacterized membrane protein YedE/YeeE